MYSTIELKLEIKGGRIIVPGCEPSSSITSVVLYRELVASGRCNNASLPLNAVLEAIPDARIEIGYNFGGDKPSKWLVLPPFEQSCPCSDYTDWYSFLAAIEVEEDEVSNFDSCNVTDFGYCREGPGIADDSTYFNEGTILDYNWYYQTTTTTTTPQPTVTTTTTVSPTTTTTASPTTTTTSQPDITDVTDIDDDVITITRLSVAGVPGFATSIPNKVPDSGPVVTPVTRLSVMGVPSFTTEIDDKTPSTNDPSATTKLSVNGVPGPS